MQEASHQAILIVEDDRSIAHMLSATLRIAGWQTVVAESLEQATSALGPDILAVVVDHNLPDGTGVELVRRMRNDPVAETLPIIMVTAAGAPELRFDGFDAGLTDFLLKPIDPAELVARLRAHLRSRATWLAILETQARRRDLILDALGDGGAGPPGPSGGTESIEDLAERLVAALLTSNQALWGVAVLEAYSAVPTVLAQRGSDGWAGVLGQHVDELTRSGRSWGTAQLMRAEHEHHPVHLATAPIRVASGTVAMLVLAELGSGERERHSDILLADAIDLAAAISLAHAPVLRGHLDDDHLVAQLDDVIEHERFRAIFQPIVTLDGQRIVGYEALTRFDDGTRPDIRFADASRTDRGLALELATLRKALEAGADLPDDCTISLNTSPRLLLERTSALKHLLLGVGRPVELELTEREAVDDYAEMKRALAQLGDLIKLAVDDAGAGFASLRHVLLLEPHMVKLDRSWVSGIEADPARQALVAGLAHFARVAGCQLVAEGVETEDERDVLLGLGLELGQGFLFGEPQSVERLYIRLTSEGGEPADLSCEPQAPGTAPS